MEYVELDMKKEATTIERPARPSRIVKKDGKWVYVMYPSLQDYMPRLPYID